MHMVPFFNYLWQSGVFMMSHYIYSNCYWEGGIPNTAFPHISFFYPISPISHSYLSHFSYIMIYPYPIFSYPISPISHNSLPQFSHIFNPNLPYPDISPLCSLLEHESLVHGYNNIGKGYISKLYSLLWYCFLGQRVGIYFSWRCSQHPHDHSTHSFTLSILSGI